MEDLTSIGDTPVSTLVGAEVLRTTPDANMFEVAGLLNRHDIGALVVDDTDAEVTAVITERDVIRSLAGMGDPSEIRVHQVASTDLVWCNADQPIAEVAAVMSGRFLRHMLVEEDGELVGIVSARDVLGAYSAAEPLGD